MPYYLEQHIHALAETVDAVRRDLKGSDLPRLSPAASFFSVSGR